MVFRLLICFPEIVKQTRSERSELFSSPFPSCLIPRMIIMTEVPLAQSGTHNGLTCGQGSTVHTAACNTSDLIPSVWEQQAHSVMMSHEAHSLCLHAETLHTSSQHTAHKLCRRLFQRSYSLTCEGFLLFTSLTSRGHLNNSDQLIKHQRKTLSRDLTCIKWLLKKYLEIKT